MQTYQNYTRLLTRNYESQKSLDRCYTDTNKYQPRLLYPAKLSITIDRENKIFHDKTKFTQYLSINPALQRIIDGKHQHKEGNYTLEEARK